MFKKSRRKIVASIMTILVCLFLGTLGVIYASSYFEVSTSNKEMLERYAELYSLEVQPGDEEHTNARIPEIEPDIDGPMDEHDEPHFEDEPAFHLSTFYSVAISDHGEVLATDIGDTELYDEETLREYAVGIIEAKKDKGYKGNLIYIAKVKQGYTLVAFMDNTIMQESMSTLFRYTLVFGSCALFLLYFLAVYMAKRIVTPLEESYQKQRQFISDAGHELKTPISVVNTNMDMLRREIGENRWLTNIEYENDRMSNLIKQLLELAKTESTASPKEILDLSRLVSGELLPFESIAFDKRKALKITIEDNILIEGNSIQLKQLVAILVDNALCHGEAQKEISVMLTAEKGMAKLSVLNYGKSFSAEQKKQLFERFYRVDEARNSETKHYGLGLSIAKAITEAHNGKIDVFCGDGTIEFFVIIPLKK